MAQLVEGLRLKTRGCGFDPRRGLWKSSSDLIPLSTFGCSGVHLASIRKGYQRIFFVEGGLNCGRHLELTTVPF